MDVRIGVIQSPKELHVELPENADHDKLVGELEAVLGTEGGVFWLTDRKGRRVGVPAARIAYVEIGSADRRVGFVAP